MPILRLILSLLFAACAVPAAAENKAALKPGAHEAIINGVRLWYRVAGQSRGTPAVFLHGGPGQGSQTFAKYAGPPLERTRRMVYLDQRGSGRSEKHWAKLYSIELMVDDVEKLRRHLGVERMDLIGHSFGTLLALEYAARYPQHVSHLVLSGTVVDFPAILDLSCARLERVDPEAYRKAVERLPAGSQRRCHIFAAGRTFVEGAMYPDPAIKTLVDETDSADGLHNTGEIFGALGQTLLDYRFTGHGRLTMPVLAIMGGKDFQAAVEPVRAFAAKVPGARVLEYEGRGHFMYVEDPERFARDVADFLKTPAGGR
jgi:proline iminopeptidase